MKTIYSRQKSHGFTLVEILVIAFVLAVLALLLLPTLAQAKRKAAQIQCANNLMQMGLAFRIWEGSHNDKYPMNISATNGLAAESAPRNNAEAIFQTMSNELVSPYALVCPTDKNCRPAPSFSAALTSCNISYFINIDASEVNPQDMMCGDDNFEVGGVPVKSGLLEISSNTPIAWSAARHRFSGNVGMADGSVQGANNATLTSWLCSTNFTTLRLAIP